jgi:hypothetical protein
MGRPPKSTLVQTEHSALEELQLKDSNGLHVPGYVFRWLNLEQRYKGRNMEIWQVVLRDSEIGAAVVEQLGPGNDKYGGRDGDSNMIYNGSDCVLGYATVEQNAALKAHKDKLAKDRIDMIDGDLLRRSVVVPGSGGYLKNAGGN